MAGYIYVMSNPAFRDRVKIGKSDREPSERKPELETTGVPEPFQIEYFAYVDDHHAAETLLHHRLKEVRPNKQREFFQIAVPDAIVTIRQTITIRRERTLYRSPDEIRQAQQKYDEELERRREAARKQSALDAEDKERREEAAQLERLRDAELNERRQKYVVERMRVPTSIALFVAAIPVVLLLLIGVGDGVIWPFLAIALVVAAAWWGKVTLEKTFAREFDANSAPGKADYSLRPAAPSSTAAMDDIYNDLFGEFFESKTTSFAPETGRVAAVTCPVCTTRCGVSKHGRLRIACPKCKNKWVVDI